MKSSKIAVTGAIGGAVLISVGLVARFTQDWPGAAPSASAAPAAAPNPVPPGAALGVAGVPAPADGTPDPTAPSADDSEQSVTVHLPLSHTQQEVPQLQDLELHLDQTITRAGVGELDGNEVGDDEYVVLAHGPDANKLFTSIERTLRSSKLSHGGFVIKRYGSADDETAREEKIDL